ncbi:MAG: hypothetical protein EHM33_06000 [Chloroflexi bacterium]|nr:MAG: hypothetical protein EHM33_06000 [Chloroflexota bacterium]
MPEYLKDISVVNHNQEALELEIRSDKSAWHIYFNVLEDMSDFLSRLQLECTRAIGDVQSRATELRNEAEGAGDESSNMELCGNCGVPRFIHDGTLEKCPNCGDDEWDLALRSEYP